MPESNNEIPPPDGPLPPVVVQKPKKYTSYTQQAILMRSELVVAGHRSDADIRTAMAPFGYNDAAIQALDEALGAGRAVVAMATRKRGEYQQSTRNTRAAFREGRDAAATFALVCRETLKDDPGALAALGLNAGAAPQALDAFLLYADTLFASALSAPQAVKEKLATRGYNDARLTAEKAKIAALHTANQRQEQARGAAQDLTPQQRKTLADLDDATMTYRKIARRALKPRPQLLEKLGVKA